MLRFPSLCSKQGIHSYFVRDRSGQQSHRIFRNVFCFCTVSMSVRQQRTPNKFIAKGFLSIHLTKLLFFEIINYPPLRKVASYLTHNFSPQDVSHYSNPAHYSDPIRNVLLTPSTHSDFFSTSMLRFSAPFGVESIVLIDGQPSQIGPICPLPRGFLFWIFDWPRRPSFFLFFLSDAG